MIELNWTFFVQMINFFILMIVLNKILYKPILGVLDERDEKIEGSHERAKELDSDGELIMENYNNKIYEAKIEAMSAKKLVQKDASTEASKIIAEASDRAETIILDVRREMELEVVKARKDLEPEVKNVAGTIAQRVVGRKVA
ncbi:MAG: ATP synthase F0 subunit B [Thermodesulfobacteriota bacterium]|nr:ATP synthase F0 subunit B [Thermodesulfobacteriota bacterium]